MSKIKNSFTSRYKDGVIMQADYSQLEVMALAQISGDPMLVADLNSGVDMHSRSATFICPLTYEEIIDGVNAGDDHIIGIRKNAKALSFLIQYGGSAKMMHRQTGVPLMTCKDFIHNYYDRYKGVKKWQEGVRDIVERSRKPTHEFIGSVQRGAGVLKSITGRRYVFMEHEAPDWLKKRGRPLSFSPTELKNYPIQGFATGDIVPLMLGELLYWVEDFNNTYMHPNGYPPVLLINTIHDSIMFDLSGSKEIIAHFGEAVKVCLENADVYLKAKFDIEMLVDFKVDIEVGPSWGELAPLK